MKRKHTRHINEPKLEWGLAQEQNSQESMNSINILKTTNSLVTRQNLIPSHANPSHPSLLFTLRVDTLSVSVDLQARLSHIRVLQEIQRHPDQVALDLVQLLAHDLHRLVKIVQMTSLTRSLGTEESVIVLETLDIVVRIRVEQVPEHFRVSRGTAGPHVPQVVVERVADHGIVLVAAFPDVVAVAGWLGVGVFGGVERLGFEQAEVLAP